MPYEEFLHTIPVTNYRIDVIGGIRRPPVYDGGGGLWQYRLKSRTTNKTPNWGYYVRTGAWKPMNNYNLLLKREARPAGIMAPYLTLYWIPTGDYSEYYGIASGDFGGKDYLEVSDAKRNEVFGRLHRNVLLKIQGQKVNLGVFLAERTQTVNLFADTAKKIAKAFTHVRRKEFREAFQALGCRESNRLNAKKTAAQNWLQLQYGWVPLLSDCYGAAEELERTFDDKVKRPPIFRAAASGIVTDDNVSSSVAFPGSKITRGLQAELRCVAYYTVDVESSQWLGRIGLTNPLEILWEASLYSFVVDWFIPIGKWIDTFDATLGCNPIGYTDSVSTVSIRRWEHKNQFDVGNFRYVYKHGKGMGRSYTYSRVALGGGFPPIELPQLKNPLSGQHMANALALLTQAFSKK